MKSNLAIAAVLVPVIAALLFLLGFEALHKKSRIEQPSMVQQDVPAAAQVVPDVLSFKNLMETRYGYGITQEDRFNSLFYSSSWPQSGLDNFTTIMPDVLALGSDLVIDAPLRVFLKDGTYSEGEQGGLLLLKIHPTTFEPVTAATYGSRQSQVANFMDVSEGGVFEKVPKTLEGHSLLKNVFLDSGAFYYDPDYYYMFMFDMTIPTPHGTPTDYVYTSPLFKIKPR